MGALSFWGSKASSGVGRLVFVVGTKDRYIYKHTTLKAIVYSLAFGHTYICTSSTQEQQARNGNDSNIVFFSDGVHFLLKDTSISKIVTF